MARVGTLCTYLDDVEGRNIMYVSMFGAGCGKMFFDVKLRLEARHLLSGAESCNI